MGDTVHSSLVLREDYEVCADVEDSGRVEKVRLCRIVSVFKIRNCMYDVNLQDIDCRYSSETETHRYMIA